MKRENRDYNIQRVASERIKDVLKERKQQIKEFNISAWPHYAASAASKVLGNSQQMTIGDLQKAAKYLNISADYLLGLTDEKEMKCATQDGAAPDPITPRDFCKMLVDMKDNMGYKIHLKKVTAKEIRAYFYESERECGTTREPIESDYLALYFTNYDGDGSIYCGEDGYGSPVYDIQPNFERKSSSINTFLEHWQRIRSAYIKGSIDKEDYDTLVSKKLSEVMDE